MEEDFLQQLVQILSGGVGGAVERSAREGARFAAEDAQQTEELGQIEQALRSMSGRSSDAVVQEYNRLADSVVAADGVSRPSLGTAADNFIFPHVFHVPYTQDPETSGELLDMAIEKGNARFGDLPGRMADQRRAVEWKQFFSRAAAPARAMAAATGIPQLLAGGR